jgi:NAD(P)-dependent dehydrogenase (short-subunit alcohol dehydrogenase family)
MLDELRNQTALVTGASNGIGAAAAVALAQRGVNLLLHYFSNSDDAGRVLAQCRQAGVQAELLQADLGTRAGIHGLTEALAGRPIDLLINNAGSLVERKRALEVTEELWDRVMSLNLTSAFFVTQAVLPGMVERKRGVVVNISSVAARHGGGMGAIAYSASKGALSTMTKGLAKEFASQGVRVNAVSPGTIYTNFHKTFSTEQMLAGVTAATPLGRLGTSEDVADVIVFLCTDAARFIVGQVIEVNGGFLMV